MKIEITVTIDELAALGQPPSQRVESLFEHRLPTDHLKQAR